MLLLRIHPTRWNQKSCRSTRFLEPSTFTTNFFDADQIVVSDAAAGVSAAWLANFNIGNDLNGLLTSNAAPANSVYLPTSWLNSGVANVGLGANSKISLPAGNAITLPTGGKFTANANILDIESSIIAPSDTIALTGDYTGASVLVDSPSAHVNPTKRSVRCRAWSRLGPA